MIHDLTNLEALLHQYDPQKVLVGPLLDLWTNSSFRVFNIAGKGGKIYETIGLGFVELEIDARRRRANIVAVLESCFGEVQIFDNQLEIAQMAHTLWANDETARFLATVSRESKPRPTRDTGQKQNLAAPDKVNVLPGDLGLSDTDAFANPGTIAESGSNLEAVRNLPAAVAGGSVSKKYRLWALSGLVAYLALSFVVGFLIGTKVFSSFTSMQQTANEATLSRNAAPSITAGNDPSQATGTVTHPIPSGHIGSANREAQPREAVRVTSPSVLTSQPDVAGGEAGAAPFTGAQPSQNPSDQAEAAPDQQLSQSPKAQGDQADGSILLPQSSPSQTAKTQSSSAETVPLSIPQPPEVAPTQVFVSQASTQLMTGHDGPQLLPSEAATPKAPEASSTAPQRQASISAIVPLPRPRPVVNAVPSDRPRRRPPTR
ncbi:MAG TPA: hypothetical protein VFN27_10095 [Xanthobacteraceae bacterium]|nr:hypothetical protein [Xanthobacteraceae bacterium]